MPVIHGTPLNKHAGRSIAIAAFPLLFPTGKANFAASRNIKVTMMEVSQCTHTTKWAAHLMWFKDGRFAHHPQFRYWALTGHSQQLGSHHAVCALIQTRHLGCSTLQLGKLNGS
ncbi:hypothetical protein K438DRAFT_1761902 [Mycena galopus ATCC 62051]|nr:hypothetical protein K438DRAFT_1761902 [Mycena galopus ATCC 62051]